MRIAITSDIYYPMMNGVAVFAHNLANGLAARGHEVAVICPSFTGKRHVVVDSETGVKNYYLSSHRMPFYPDQINKVADNSKIFGKKLPKLVYKNGLWVSVYPHNELKAALDDFQPNLIHNQTAETIAIAALWYARKREVPIVSTGHAYPDNITGQLKLLAPIKKPLDVILRAYMASFLKNSEYATMPTEMAIEDLVPKDRRKFKVKIEAISNGIDLSRFQFGPRPETEFYEKYGLPSDKKIVLYVGRVDPEKSIEVAMRAFLKMRERKNDVCMVVVGDGIDKSRLEEFARKSDYADDVYFMGRIMGDDLIKFYRAGDVFVTASETETQGLVLIEAAAMKLPIVAVDAGAVKEVCVNNVNGVLCSPKDAEGISSGLLRILSDEKLAEEMGERSLDIAKKHDLNYTLKRFEEIYGEVIAGKTKGNC